jgi:competence protein ComEC
LQSSAGHEHARKGSGKSAAEFEPFDGPSLAASELILQAPLYFALGMCAGAIAYFSLPFEPDLLVVAALGMCLASGALIALKYVSVIALRITFLLVLGAAAGGISAKIHTAIRPVPALTQALGPTIIEGWVTSVEQGANGVRLRLRVHAIGGQSSSSLPDTVRLTHTLSLNVAPGRFVRCWAVLRPPPQPSLPGDYDFSRQAFFEGLSGVGYVQGRCRGGTLGPPISTTGRVELSISRARRQLAEHVRQLSGDRAGGFAAALSSGDRSFMRAQDVEALRRSGLAHLLAISGLHLGIVGGLVFFAVRRSLALWEWLALRVAVQKLAAAIALVALAIYMVLSGASISTQRAFVMAAVFFGAIILDRSPLSFRSFAVAMITILFLQPFSVMTPGFQMSFAATGALIAVYTAWRRYSTSSQNIVKESGLSFMLKSLVLTSIVGAAATAPFALYHFNRVAPAGIIANLAAMPIVTFISAPAAGLALITAPFGLDGIFLRVFGWSLERVLMIAHWTAGQEKDGFQLGERMSGSMLIVMSAATAAVCLSRTAKTAILTSAAAAVLCLICWMASPKLVLHWSASGDIYVREDDKPIKRYEFARGDALSPLAFSDLELTSDCGKSTCMFDTASGQVAVISSSWNGAECPDPIPYILNMSSDGGACSNTKAYALNWDTVEASKGVTILRPLIGPDIISSPMCGRRPWAPCLDE